VLLYVIGDMRLLGSSSVAIVGSRNATQQGVTNAERFARSLSDSGLTVVSGLALGIDAAAHRGGIAGKSSTIAVLGCGADIVYPMGNEPLYAQIAESGAIVSEFPLGAPPLGRISPSQSPDLRLCARVPGYRGSARVWIPDHSQACRGAGPRGIRDPGIDPLAPFQGMPCADQAGRETCRVCTGCSRGTGPSCISTCTQSVGATRWSTTTYGV